ncbi:hypothetical protein [Nonomuraea diastatica]|uniref:Uncharacterized protein n=1 Tax=Nonomuraea diastatica TaxID=1848329 RepID=A0A4R4VVU2_9ACTN|nr:hypothetical protein [Nonomuraea diastatica]TDD08407.1 hypothetical protein E1294_47570 [Nonomuraea diastatica]
MAIGLLCGLAYAAIGWFWVAKPLEVDAGAISQIEKVGGVVARTELRYTEADSVIVTEYLIVDRRLADEGAAVDDVSRALQSNNWKVVTQLSYPGVQLRSGQWPDHLLTLETPDGTNLSLNDKLGQAVREAQAVARYPDALVVLSVRRTDT